MQIRILFNWHFRPVFRPNLGAAFRAEKNLIELLPSWFANSFVYYGLTLNSGNLGGTVMVNFLLNGATEIPAYAFSLYILLRQGGLGFTRVTRAHVACRVSVIHGLNLLLTQERSQAALQRLHDPRRRLPLPHHHHSKVRTKR